MSLGKRMRLARKSAKYSISEAAKQLGISQSYLSNLENDKRSNPSMDLLYSMARFYLIPIEALTKDVSDLDNTHLVMGKKLYHQKKYMDAIAEFQRVLALSELSKDISLQIEARQLIAKSFYRNNKFNECLKHLDIIEAYDLTEEQKIHNITLRGICLNFLSRFDEAVQILMKLQSFNSELALRKMHINIGVVYYRQHKYCNKDTIDLALYHFNQALKFSLDPFVTNKLYRNIGLCFASQGNFMESVQMFRESLKYTNSEQEVMYTKIDMAHSLSILGNIAESNQLLQSAKTYLHSIQDSYGLGHTLLFLGYNSFRQNDYKLGEKLIHEAIDYYMKSDSFAEISECYLSLINEFKDIDPVRTQIYQIDYHHFYKKVF